MYLHKILSAKKKIQIYIFGFPYLSKLIVTANLEPFMEISDSQDSRGQSRTGPGEDTGQDRCPKINLVCSKQIIQSFKHEA